MSLRFSSANGVTCLYDSVTDWAFGPVFYTEEAAKAFLDWAEGQGVRDGDVRALVTVDLLDLWDRYSEEVEDSRG